MLFVTKIEYFMLDSKLLEMHKLLFRTQIEQSKLLVRIKTHIIQLTLFTLERTCKYDQFICSSESVTQHWYPVSRQFSTNFRSIISEHCSKACLVDGNEWFSYVVSRLSVEVESSVSM